MCSENTEPVENSNTDAFLQSFLEGRLLGWQLLGERPKGVHHTNSSVCVLREEQTYYSISTAFLLE